MIHGVESTSGEFSVYREFERAERVIFIGSDPMQYSEWPERPIPKWQPVWLICINGDAQDDREVVFAGSSPERCAPSPPDRQDPGHNKWTKCLKEFGDVNFSADQGPERNLWFQYVDAASTNRVWSTGTSMNTQLVDELRKLKQ